MADIVVGLDTTWSNKYRNMAITLCGKQQPMQAWETQQSYRYRIKGAITATIHQYAAEEIERVLRPMATVDDDDIFETIVVRSVLSFVPFGNYGFSKLEKHSFVKKLKKRIGLHRKGSSTEGYDFRRAITAEPCSFGYKQTADKVVEMVGVIVEKVGMSMVPIVGALMHAAALEPERSECVEKAIKRGTHLHCLWISAFLDALLSSILR